MPPGLGLLLRICALLLSCLVGIVLLIKGAAENPVYFNVYVVTSVALFVWIYFNPTD